MSAEQPSVRQGVSVHAPPEPPYLLPLSAAGVTAGSQFGRREHCGGCRSRDACNSSPKLRFDWTAWTSKAICGRRGFDDDPERRAIGHDRGIPT
jgi:hypothetical protein